MIDERAPEQRNSEESHLAGPPAPFMYGYGYDLAVQLNKQAEVSDGSTLFTREELAVKIGGLTVTVPENVSIEPVQEDASS